MLQASEIQKRFTHLEQTIEKASQACHADATLPKRPVQKGRSVRLKMFQQTSEQASLRNAS
jgi:hypothetical protein